MTRPTRAAESVVSLERLNPWRRATRQQEPVVTKGIKYVGLDVHAESISAAVSEGRGEVRSLGKIFSTPEAVRRLLCKLGKLSELRVCYEAGPTGYALYWQLTKMGVQCEVIAPSMIPRKAGDRVKTDSFASHHRRRSSCEKNQSQDLTGSRHINVLHARPPQQACREPKSAPFRMMGRTEGRAKTSPAQPQP